MPRPPRPPPPRYGPAPGGSVGARACGERRRTDVTAAATTSRSPVAFHAVGRQQFGQFIRGTATLSVEQDGMMKERFAGDSVFAWDATEQRIAYYIWSSDGSHGLHEAHYDGIDLAFPIRNRKAPDTSRTAPCGGRSTTTPSRSTGRFPMAMAGRPNSPCVIAGWTENSGQGRQAMPRLHRLHPHACRRTSPLPIPMRRSSLRPTG